jgi:hypothetical protein
MPSDFAVRVTVNNNYKIETKPTFPYSRSWQENLLKQVVNS